MLSKEYIEKFEKIISSYSINKEDIYDIVRAISFSESDGTHPIRLKDLAVSGVDYFSDIVSDKTDAVPLSDVRLARILVDSLVVILHLTNNNIFAKPDMVSVLANLSYPVQKVINYVNVFYTQDRFKSFKADKSATYKTLEECERDLNKLLSTYKVADDKSINDLHSLLDFINKYCSIKYNFVGLKLPEQYRGSLDDIYFCKDAKYIKTTDTILDCITNCLLEHIIGNRDKLKLSLLMTTKARYINIAKKPIIKVKADKYALIRQDNFVINSLNTAYTFTHADSLQNVDSIKLLYALLFATSTEAKRIGSESVLGGN